MVTTRQERRPLWRSPGLRAGVLWLSGVALAAAAVALAVGFVLSTGKSLPADEVAAVPGSAKLPKDAEAVVRRFVVTAVGRGDLGEAWTLVGPHLRRGMTIEEWKKGNIPIAPLPTDSIDYRLKVDYAYATEAVIEIALLPKRGFNMDPQIFFLTLVKVGPEGKKRWVVDGWVPRPGA
jgi:hypothetical protein